MPVVDDLLKMTAAGRNNDLPLAHGAISQVFTAHGVRLNAVATLVPTGSLADTITTSAAYIQGWIEHSRNSLTLIVQAVAQAQARWYSISAGLSASTAPRQRSNGPLDTVILLAQPVMLHAVA